MNGKDFLLNLNPDKLFEVYFKTYYEQDYILDLEAKKNNYDKKETMRNGFSVFLSELEKVVPITTDKNYKLLSLPGYDYDLEDDLSYKIYKIEDVCLLDMNSIKQKPDIKEINSREEIPNEFLFETYSLMFISWEELLGYELVYIPETEEELYDAAAYFAHELSWFGYTKETVKKNEAIEREKLDKAIEECKDPENLKTFSLADLYEEFGFEPPSEEEKALTQKLTDEIIVKSYNEKIKIYKKYLLNEVEI